MAEKFRLLAVDDDPDSLALLKRYLAGDIYHTVLAEDGDIAWNILEKEPEGFDAVLLDRTMPIMDGMEVLKNIKSHPLLMNVPVILQTAKTSDEEMMEGIKAGAFYYLKKPFKKEQLLSIVKAAVSDFERYKEQRDSARKTVGSFSLLKKGEYVFRTLEDAGTLSSLLAQTCANPENVTVGLHELLLNAVEHGNLGLTYEEKSRLLESDGWRPEIERRLASEEYGKRQATLLFERNENKIDFTIKDEGNGFDWEKYMELSPERAFDMNGRGIAMSKSLSFDKIEYLGSGNEVRATVFNKRGDS